MRTTMLRFGSLVLAGSVAFSACGDDTSTDAQSEFNEFEATQVLNAVAAVLDNADQGAPGFAAAIEDFNATIQCPNGGTAVVDGTRDPAPAVVDFDARVQYVNCENASVRLHGFIDVTATSSVPSTGAFRVTWTFKGTVTSAKDGQTRSCTMDVTRVRTTTGGSTATTVNGNVCGRTVNS
jgi:hypothetical protein